MKLKRKVTMNEFRTVIINCKSHGSVEYKFNDNTQTPIQACCAGALLGISASAVREGKAGTDKIGTFRLSDSPKAPVRCFLERVIALRDSRVSIAESLI